METATDNLPAVQRITTVTEKITSNLPRLQKGNEIAMTELKEIQAMTIENDDQETLVIEKLTKVRSVYQKVNALRVEITGPIDELKDFLMTFERSIDDRGKDNEYAKAKQVVTDYQQKKLDEKKKAEILAEQIKQLSIYKAEIKAGVGRQLAQMLAGQIKNITDRMYEWEKSINLENFEGKVKGLNTPREYKLDEAKYNACFHTNFNKSFLMNDELTKEYVESLKAEHPYKQFNDTYVTQVVEIVNGYRAKMPDVKHQLEAAKQNAEKEKERLANLEAERNKTNAMLDEQLSQAVKSVEDSKDMDKMEAEFVSQAQTQDLSAGPVKKEALFEDELKWLKPLQEVIAVVASSGVIGTIKKKNGKEYIDGVQFWLTKLEAIDKPVSGIVLKEVPKTIVRSKV